MVIFIFYFQFLHENGLLLHYDDATLRDLYFLDPQVNVFVQFDRNNLYIYSVPKNVGYEFMKYDILVVMRCTLACCYGSGNQPICKKRNNEAGRS